ncbi:MAG: DivIVA domain-containing protein [Firmicutes bacterium]|nr:DivIVA domain-containing protein [Bacillota bacterium]
MTEKMPFLLEANGYSRDQVDKYLSTVSDEYEAMHAEYMHNLWVIDQLEEENRDLRDEILELKNSIHLLEYGRPDRKAAGDA